MGSFSMQLKQGGPQRIKAFFSSVLASLHVHIVLSFSPQLFAGFQGRVRLMWQKSRGRRCTWRCCHLFLPDTTLFYWRLFNFTWVWHSESAPHPKVFVLTAFVLGFVSRFSAICSGKDARVVYSKLRARKRVWVSWCFSAWKTAGAVDTVEGHWVLSNSAVADGYESFCR